MPVVKTPDSTAPFTEHPEAAPVLIPIDDDDRLVELRDPGFAVMTTKLEVADWFARGAVFSSRGHWLRLCLLNRRFNRGLNHRLNGWRKPWLNTHGRRKCWRRGRNLGLAVCWHLLDYRSAG
jgi:hypothetical protein